GRGGRGPRAGSCAGSPGATQATLRRAIITETHRQRGRAARHTRATWFRRSFRRRSERFGADRVLRPGGGGDRRARGRARKFGVPRAGNAAHRAPTRTARGATAPLLERGGGLRTALHPDRLQVAHAPTPLRPRGRLLASRRGPEAEASA